MTQSTSVPKLFSGALAEPHRIKGLFLLRSAALDSLAAEYPYAQELPAFVQDNSDSQVEEEFLRGGLVDAGLPQDPAAKVPFVCLSPFGSHFLAAIVGGVTEMPCARNSRVFYHAAADSSLYGLFAIACVQGPEGKVFIDRHRYSAQYEPDLR